MPWCAGGEDAASRRPMRSAESAPPLRHAVALGLMQGPAELLPISSSGHTTLIPWLVGWSYGELRGGPRKAFEVPPPAGGGIALAIDMRGELSEQLRSTSPRRALLLALSLGPAAIAGFA